MVASINGASDQCDMSTNAAAFCHQLRADPTQLRPARHAITRWATCTGLGTDQVGDLTFAVSEALSNSIEHAYPAEDGLIWVDAHVAGGQVRVIVSDHGHWRIPDTDPGSRGRGLSVICAITDHAHLEHGEGATTVTMVWNLSGLSARRTAGTQQQPPPSRHR